MHRPCFSAVCKGTLLVSWEWRWMLKVGVLGDSRQGGQVCIDYKTSWVHVMIKLLVFVWLGCLRLPEPWIGIVGGIGGCIVCIQWFGSLWLVGGCASHLGDHWSFARGCSCFVCSVTAGIVVRSPQYFHRTLTRARLPFPGVFFMQRQYVLKVSGEWVACWVLCCLTLLEQYFSFYTKFSIKQISFQRG